MMFIIMQFPPQPVCLPFRSKYLPQNSVLKNPPFMFLPQSERPSFTPKQHNWQNYSFVYFNLLVLSTIIDKDRNNVIHTYSGGVLCDSSHLISLAVHLFQI